jgi:hypothetical protein
VCSTATARFGTRRARFWSRELKQAGVYFSTLEQAAAANERLRLLSVAEIANWTSIAEIIGDNPNQLTNVPT